ncbi:hypothetical protein V499_04647 [Pseudogymnoascus sp. VKM F-103]|nr:hypothetical protein V499_04647 [Pseudogymnoascus sp. VKM F-103]
MRFSGTSLTIAGCLLASISEASKSSSASSSCQLHNVETYPPPPVPEPISIIKLPLPPSIVSDEVGACTKDINPNGTGCLRIVLTGDDSLPQGGTFTPDGTAIVVTVNFTGAPAQPDPASIYSGEHIILLKTDNTTFSSGDPWKCITCGVPAASQLGRNKDLLDYPRVFKDGKRFLVGTNIVETGGYPVDSELVTPNNTYIYPIYWPVTGDGSGSTGAMRELRLHPGDHHLSWSSFDGNGQNSFYGRLTFNPVPTTGEPRVPRYDLFNVSILQPATGNGVLYAEGNELKINQSVPEIGELRGFSGSGKEFTYIGYPMEACNFDGFAVNLLTGAVRRLTSHPEYVDPMDISADDEWTAVLDTRGTDRQMFMSGMRGIPPLSDLVTSGICASVRNNGMRRFFRPILIDKYGDRGDYFGQTINAGGDGSPGSINDPNWNARADPQFSLDGTRLMYYETLVKTPACGGENPLPCPVSTEPDGRTTRIMIATFASRKPYPVPKFDIGPDVIPWAIPYVPGMELPVRQSISPGKYTYKGKHCGYADVAIYANANSTRFNRVRVDLHNLSEDGENILNGFEDISLEYLDTWTVLNDWRSNIVQRGKVKGVKETSPGGFQIQMNLRKNLLEANGTLTTTLDGKTYYQPKNNA